MTMSGNASSKTSNAMAPRDPMGEDEPRREAYHLQRMTDGDTTTVAVFYSTKEALTIMPSLGERYRLVLGDRQIWPN